MDVAFQLECINSYVIGTEARAHLDIARLVLADVQKHLFIATASK